MVTKLVRFPTEHRQTEIVLTLLQLAAQQSALEITTTDIAKAMNVSQGALFRHFPTKEAIRLAVVAWIEAGLMARLDEARQSAEAPDKALRAMFSAHVGFFVAYPGAPRFIFGELQQPAHNPVKERVCGLMARYRKLLETVLEEAVADGTVRADIDRKAASALFLGAIQGLVIQSLVTNNVSRMSAQANSVFALYLSALKGGSE